MAVDLDAPVTDKLLSNLASNFYPEHLDRFVTSLLGWDDVTFHRLQHDARNDSWRTPFFVSVKLNHSVFTFQAPPQLTERQHECPKNTTHCSGWAAAEIYMEVENS